ncbi:MAG TPA: hypothetical protein GXX72_05670 [Clostridiaceae bacterium]|nr:hypothetical protein [Clostridiaceae bacterium]
MLSKRISKTIFVLGIILLLAVLLSKFTTIDDKTTRMFLAVGGKHSTSIYLMILLPLLLLLGINILNFVKTDKTLRIITLIINGLTMVWGIILYYVLAGDVTLKSTPAIYLLLAGLIFFVLALKTNPDFENE